MRKSFIHIFASDIQKSILAFGKVLVIRNITSYLFLNLKRTLSSSNQCKRLTDFVHETEVRFRIPDNVVMQNIGNLMKDKVG